MRVPMIAGNWKMNTTLDDAVALVNSMLPGLDGVGGVDKLVCPPFISLAAVKDVLKAPSSQLDQQQAE